MQVKIKRLNENAVIPKYSKLGDAGLDLTATSKEYKDGNIVYGVGLSVEIPDGYVGLIFPRSSLTKYDLALGNHVGVVDSGYRGEILFKFKYLDRYSNVGHFREEYDVGDRIGQLLILPYPQIELVEAEELSSTERGSGSYGSSGT